MTDGTSERRQATHETSQTGDGSSISERLSASPAARRYVTPARTRTPKEIAITVVKGLANLVFMALVVYLTYFFTVFFSTRPPAPLPSPRVSGWPPRRSRNSGPRSAGS